MYPENVLRILLSKLVRMYHFMNCMLAEDMCGCTSRWTVYTATDVIIPCLVYLDTDCSWFPIRSKSETLKPFFCHVPFRAAKALRHPWLGDLAAKDPPPSPLQQPTLPTGMGTMPPLPETLSFSVPPAVMAAGAVAGGNLNSPDPQARQQVSKKQGKRASRVSYTLTKQEQTPQSPCSIRSAEVAYTWQSGQQVSGCKLHNGTHYLLCLQRGGNNRGAWGGRPPVVTEQQTPPATSTKKSFEFTPTGPTIREVCSPPLNASLRGSTAPGSSTYTL